MDPRSLLDMDLVRLLEELSYARRLLALVAGMAKVLTLLRSISAAGDVHSIASISSKTQNFSDVNLIWKSVKDEGRRMRGFLVCTTWRYFRFHSVIGICIMWPWRKTGQVMAH